MSRSTLVLIDPTGTERTTTPVDGWPAAAVERLAFDMVIGRQGYTAAFRQGGVTRDFFYASGHRAPSVSAFIEAAVSACTVC